MLDVWIGYDPREYAAFAVAKITAERAGGRVHPLILDDLRERGWYWRRTERRLGRLHDVISNHAMATEFAISRFLVPAVQRKGWALFVDCDVMFRAPLSELLDQVDDRYAVMCVKHDYVPISGRKMDDQIQTPYPRKNWSSVMLFNCDHRANTCLTKEFVNEMPGRDLHRFSWLGDDEIGALDPEWNWLVGEEPPPADPKIVHWTLGGPWFSQFVDAPYAEEWRASLKACARE